MEEDGYITRLEALRLSVESFQKYTQQARPEHETVQILDRAEEFANYLVGQLRHKGGEGNG